ncbi:MAG: phosphoribosylglycinamide formyltransferase [Acidobacteria bacterium]|nr:phosphoribosylglycinamide formyltransferase [Acidobacteriota bacterium]MDW7984553.1 phosphoribosylglycinamide formyltransferase [Acidobacteriota bacterium]
MNDPASDMGRIVILISGRGTNMERLIQACLAGEIPAQVVRVISDNPAAQGLQRAQAYGVPTVIVPARAFPDRAAFEEALLEAVREAAPDLICLAGFMRILSPRFVQAYRYRIMNIHPALLPSFPGLHAQRQALEYGVKVSGCTVHFVDEGVDTGPIIVQKAVPVREDDTEATLAARILEKEHEAYPEAVRLFFEGRLRVEGRRVRILER